MKKKLAFILIAFIAAGQLHAVSFYAGADLMSLDSLINRNIFIRGEAGMRSEDVRISVGAGYFRCDDADLKVSAVTSSLSFDCHPFMPLGFYVGATLIGHTWFFGPDAPEEESRFGTSIRAGWTFDLMKHLSLDLRVSVHDPSLKEEGLPQLGTYRFAFLVLYRTGADNKE